MYKKILHENAKTQLKHCELLCPNLRENLNKAGEAERYISEGLSYCYWLVEKLVLRYFHDSGSHHAYHKAF